jgi:hypothetical protein
MLRRLTLNTWLLLGMFGLWRSLTYLHPEPIVRAPRRLYGSPAREIPEMRLDELFTTDLKAPS